LYSAVKSEDTEALRVVSI